MSSSGHPEQREEPPFLKRRARTLAAVLVLAGCGDGFGDISTPKSPPLSELSLFPTRRAALVGKVVNVTVNARDLAYRGLQKSQKTR